MADKVFNVLFICTTNCSRSILAEAILNREGDGRFRGYSAGSFPAGAVNPDTHNVLTRLGFDVAELRSKSWDEFGAPNAPHMDFVFTLCDDAADEPCPTWPGHPVSAHWGIEDPVSCEDETRDHAVCQALRFLENRISLFTSLPFEKLDKIALHGEVKSIGRVEGASVAAA
jgi:arsenate reductase